MAQDVEIRIKAAVEGAQAAETLGALKKALTELQAVAEDTDIGSEQFKTLQTEIASTTNKLADTSDRLGDVGDRLRTLSGTPVERLSASFGLLKESIFNLDVDKAKIAVDGLVNSFTPLGADGKPLQGLKAMGPVLSNLGAGVMSLGQTFVTLGRTLLANPIFLLATAISLIAVGIVGLLNKLGLLTPILNTIGAAVEFVTDAFGALTEAIGLGTAASDKYLTKLSENAEKEREEIDKTYKARVAVAQALEGLDSRQIASISKITGIYLEQGQTVAELQRKAAETRKANLADEIAGYEKIQKKNGALNEDQKKKLDELRDKYQSTNVEIINIEANKFKKLEDLQNRNAQMNIDKIADAGERAKAQAAFDIQMAQQSRDQIAILLEKERTAQIKGDAIAAGEARKEINLLTQERMLLEQKAEREKNEKLNDIYKQNLENQKKFSREGLNNLETLGKIAILKEAENSKARADAEIKSLNDIYDYRVKNRKLLEISDKELELENLQRLEKVRKIEEDYNKSTFAMRKAQVENYIDQVNAELDRFNSTLEDKSRKITLPFTKFFQGNFVTLGREVTASAENIKKVQLQLQEEVLAQTAILLNEELKERKRIGKLTIEEEGKFATQIAAIQEKLFTKRQERINYQYEITRLTYEKESADYAALQKKKTENLEAFTKKDAEDLVLQSAMRSIALKNAFKEEIDLRTQVFMQQNNISKGRLKTDEEAQKKLAEFNEETIKTYNQRRIEIEKQTTKDIIALNEGVYNANVAVVDKQLKITNDLSINRVKVIKTGLNQAIDDLNAFQNTEISMLAQSYMDKNNLTFQQLQNDKDLFAQFTAEKAAIEQDYNLKRVLAAEDAAQKTANARAEEARKIAGITNDLTTSIGIVSDIAFAEEEKRIKGNVIEEEKAAKRKFELNKGLQIASAIADGYRAATAFVATNPLFVGGLPNPLAFIGLGTTIALAVANVAKIAATQYQSKTPPSVSTPSAGGSSNASATPQPTFTPGQFFGLGGQAPVNVGVGGPNQVGPQKVFVVETDITSTQRGVRGIEQRAEIE